MSRPCHCWHSRKS